MMQSKFKRNLIPAVITPGYGVPSGSKENHLRYRRMVSSIKEETHGFGATVKMAKLLVFTVLLCAVAAQIGVHAAARGWREWCYSDEMQCQNGVGCYAIGLRCDGEQDCRDGSDEAGCNAIARTTLAVNQIVTVRAQYKKHYEDAFEENYIEYHLCNAQTCNVVALFGHYSDGRLGTSTWTGCNLRGRDCADEHSGAHGIVKELPSGEVVVQVQRRPNELALWSLDRPDDVTTVPTENDQHSLVVRTYKLWDFMPVQFS